MSLIQNKNKYFAPTRKQKEKNDFQLAKDLLIEYANMSGRSVEELDRINENYELMRGSWSNLENMEDSTSLNMASSKFGLEAITLKHYPKLDKAVSRILGQIISQPLVVFLKDQSPEATAHRNRVRIEAAKQYLYLNYVKPEIDKIRQDYFNQLGIEDPSVLPLNQQQSIEREVQNLAENALPQDLTDNLELYLTRDEKIIKSFLDYIIEYQQVEDKFIEGAEPAVAIAEEYYKVTELHNNPYMEVLNPKGVTWGGSQNVVFVENGTWARYEQYLTVSDVIQKYGDVLENKDIKTLKNLFTDVPEDSNRSDSYDIDQRLQLEVSQKVWENPQLNDIDVKTKEGQNVLKHLYSYVSRSNDLDSIGVKETYVTFKWSRPAWLVTRNINGKIKLSIESEHYVKNPAAGDIKVERRLIPEVWEGTTLGSAHDIIVYLRPVPFQYPSLGNLFDVKLTIFGGKLNTFQNNAKNSSFLDLGKPGQYEINTLKRDQERYRATNFGNILLGHINMIPDGEDPIEWYKMAMYGKLALVSTHYEGINASDLQYIRSVNMSNDADIAAIEQQIIRAEDEMYQDMFLSRAQLGQIGQYTTATTSRLNVQAANLQFARFFNVRAKIQRSVIDRLLNLTLGLYKDNEYKKSIILDDYSRAYFDANYDLFHTKEFNLFVVNNFRESEKLETLRSNLLALTQNGLTAKDLILFIKADSVGELEEIAEKMELRQRRLLEQQAVTEQQVLEQQRAREVELLKIKEELQAVRDDKKYANNLRMAEIQSSFMERGADINENKVADSLESKLLDIESKERIAQLEVESKEKIAEIQARSRKN